MSWQFNIAIFMAFENISSLCLSIMLYVSFLLIDQHDEQDTNLKHKFVCNWIFGIPELTNFKILYSNIYPTRCNFTQFIYTWKLLYMFRVVLPPIISSAYNCIYSIRYLSHLYCYLPLSWKSWKWFQLFHSNSRQQYGVTVTRCCSYSCLCSWRWVIVTLEICRAVVR
jgi:hypothetical protein